MEKIGWGTRRLATPPFSIISFIPAKIGETHLMIINRLLIILILVSPSRYNFSPCL